MVKCRRFFRGATTANGSHLNLLSKLVYNVEVNMKKFIAIFLCSLILCGLAGCKKEEDLSSTTLEEILNYTYQEEVDSPTYTIRILKRVSDTKYISQYQFEAIENKDTKEEIVYCYSTEAYPKNAPQSLQEFIKKDEMLKNNDIYTKLCDYSTAYNIQVWTEGLEVHTYKSAIISLQANEKSKQITNQYLDYIENKTNASPEDLIVSTAEFVQSEIYKLAGMDWINTILDVDETASKMVDDVDVLTEGIENFANFLGSVTEDWDEYLGLENVTRFENKKENLRKATINKAKELYNAIKNINNNQENTQNSTTDSYTTSPTDNSSPSPYPYVNTYITNREKQSAKYPTFAFDYSDNWKISKEELSAEPEFERVILENERGVTFQYYQSDVGFGSRYYGGGYILSYAKATKIADSSFKPGSIQSIDYSSLGNFVVAKFENYAEEDGLTGTQYDITGKGMVLYTIIPESYIGEMTYKGLGYYACLAWEYPSHITVMVETPDKTFTPQEEQEIIHMLSSFREIQVD